MITGLLTDLTYEALLVSIIIIFIFEWKLLNQNFRVITKTELFPNVSKMATVEDDGNLSQLHVYLVYILGFSVEAVFGFWLWWMRAVNFQ